MFTGLSSPRNGMISGALRAWGKRGRSSMADSAAKQKGIIVVAGGAGFIGSHLCDFLIERGEGVICIDSLITGDKKNIAHLKKNKKFKFLKADVSKKISVAGKISQIYNLASPASPVDYQQKPLETLSAGSDGVKNLLELER